MSAPTTNGFRSCVDASPKQLIEITHYRSTDGTRIEDSEYIRRGVGEI